jgi:CheY-like chemotaxis protein
VSTRILFADDSVTAQNMGKRILTEAGYDVVAVSNGAAAVKKIAEQKPDIIILDLYMPGYSGLEVCEKVRGSMATLKTPVLLTVGKMEPYRPEDANRVRADGVIVKPFEASDLLAIVKKFEERIVSPPPPLAQHAFATATEEDTAVIEELSMETSTPAAGSAQPTLDVPDHMATSSAFADLLGVETPEAGSLKEKPRVPFESAVASVPERTGVPEYELPVAWKREEVTAKTEIELPPPATSVSGPEPPQHDVQPFETGTAHHEAVQTETTDVAPPPAPSRPLQIPVYQESAEAAEPHEMLRTAAAPIGEIEIPRDPYLQESAAETTRNTIATSTEPGLISGLQMEPEQIQPERSSQSEIEAAELSPPSSGFGSTNSQSIPVEVPLQAPEEPFQTPATRHETPYADADFEARVAAALATCGYADKGARTSAAEAVPEILKEPETPTAAVAKETEEPVRWDGSNRTAAESVSPVSFQPEPPVSAEPSEAVSVQTPQEVSAFEYHPPIGASPTEANTVESSSSAAMASGAAAAFAVAYEPKSVDRPELEPVEIAPAPDPHVAVAESEAAPRMDTSPAFAPTPSDSHAERESIAHAVYRAMERLRPDLVDEILRELKSKE